MSNSDLQECPVCSKSYAMSTINRHVEECLAMGDMLPGTSRSNAPKSPPISSHKIDKSSFFNQGKFVKSLDSKRKPLEKSPQNQQKRDLTSPPGKRAKIDSTNSYSMFFQRNKETPTPPSSSSQHNDSVNETLLNKPKGKDYSNKGDFIPLAEKMRPCMLQDYEGQSKIVGPNSLLRSLLEANEVPSMILWGPPGCGKTSLAHIIANGAKKSSNTRFVTLSATTSGIHDVKEVIKVAKNEQQMFKRKTILFMDEIHRFNKSQQDTFLPHVENGTIILIGATTENPSFQLNNALLSRCRVIVLEKLTTEALQKILLRAVRNMKLSVDEVEPVDLKASHPPVVVEKDAITALANLCDGDARVALNGLQLAVQSQVAKSAAQKKTKHASGKHRNNIDSSPSQDGLSPLTDGNLNLDDVVKVNVSHIKEGLQKTHLLYDKKGEEHYNIVSALHKSIRGSDANASLYWLARMLAGGEEPLYVARRLVRFASEDVGLADPMALNQAVAAYQACHFIGMPECDVILAQATVYLARAPKSIEVYKAYNNAKKCVKEWSGPHPSVPLHIRNAPTKLMKNLGYGSGYKYNPDYDGPVDQSYLPSELSGVDFF